MKIEKIILKEYQRLSLRQIKHFEYTPTKKTQAILGSNGSGKSSLIEELSPLPANSKYYNTGGSKEVWISHQGKSYYLASLFTEEGNKFIFECDDRSLNDGYTITGYRELVQQHFNYTKERHAVMTGAVKFSGMSVNDRRNWLMLVSGLDYDYAVAFYKRTKEMIRGLQSALARTQERLAQETSLLITPEQEHSLIEKIKTEKEKLDLLLNNRPLLNVTIKEQDYLKTTMAIETSLRAVEALVEEYSKIGSRQPLKTLYGLKNTILEDISILSKEVVRYQRSILQLQQQLKEYSGLEGVDVPALELEVARLRTIVTEAEQNRTLDLSDRPDACLGELDLCRGELDQYLAAAEGLISTNGDNVRLEELTTQLSNYAGILKDTAKLKEILELREKELRLKRDEGEIACPGCDHRWIPNYNAAEHEQIILDIKRVNEKQKEHEETQEKLDSEKKVLSRYLNLRQGVFTFFWNHASLKPVWHKLLQPDGGKEIVFCDSSRVRFIIEQARQELQLEVAAKQATITIEQHEKIITIAKAAEKKDKGKLLSLMAEENDHLANLQRQINAHVERRDQVTAEITLLEEINAVYSTGQQQRVDHAYQGKQLVLKQLSQAMQEASYHHAANLSNYEKQRSQIELRKSIIKDHEKEAAQLKHEIELLQHTEAALSPSTGLIAQGMTNFINSFVKTLNAIIAMVWIYPLEIASIEAGDDEALDYRFVVKVNGQELPPDVGNVSEGMKEIINLSFVLASMHFLGMLEYPVFLDEFAVKMDAAHRDAAYKVIDYLAESEEFSQLFLISHYESGYTNLADAEILVLCPANIVLPATLAYNQHCVIA